MTFGISKRQGRDRQFLERQHQSETGDRIVGQGVGRHLAAPLRGQPHIAGLGDQIADRERQSVGTDDDSVTDALLAQYAGGGGVLGHHGAQFEQRPTERFRIDVTRCRLKMS